MKNVTVSMPIEEYNKLKEMAEKGERLESTVQELEEAKNSIKLTVSTLDQVYHDCDRQLYNKYNAKFTIEKIIEELLKTEKRTPLRG